MIKQNGSVTNQMLIDSVIEIGELQDKLVEIQKRIAVDFVYGVFDQRINELRDDIIIELGHRYIKENTNVTNGISKEKV